MKDIDTVLQYNKNGEISFEKNGDKYYIRAGYIFNIEMGVKIFPFEFEDLSKNYNIQRFPDRERRNPNILNKYNFFGDIAIVIGYKYLESVNFAKKSPIYIAKKLSNWIDIKEKTIKAKMSQLKAYIKTNEKSCSIGLIKTYLNFKNVPYYKFEEVANKSHNNIYEIKKSFEELLYEYPSEYKYKRDYIIYES